MIEILTIFTGIIFAQLFPGPNMMAVASASLGAGRAAGIVTALGISSGVLVWCVLFLFGFETVLQAFPQTLIVMKVAGGSYLAFLGLKAFKSAIFKSKTSKSDSNLNKVDAAFFRRGFLVVMTNPKAALMWAAISMFLTSLSLAPVQFLGIGAGASLSAAIIYGAYAVLFSTDVAVRGYGRFYRVIEGVFGIIFGVLGGKLLIEGIRELRT